MPRASVVPENLPPAGGPYSPATHIGDLVWTAGQVGYLPDKTLPDGLDAQVRQSFANLFAALQAAGASEADVTAVNVFLADTDDFDEMNRIYRDYFTQPYPARTTVTVRLRPGVLFEINAQAVISRDGSGGVNGRQ